MIPSSAQPSKGVKSLVSPDAPPLDFSFRDIRNLDEILTMKPHQGKRKPIQQTHQQEQVMSQDKSVKTEQNGKEHKEEQPVIERPVEVKLQIVRTIEVSTMIAAQTQQNQVKQKNEAETGLKKVQSVQLETSSLYLSYNKLTTIKNFHSVVSSVFPDLSQLKWVDLSHNRLVILDYDFKDIKQLKTLYLHCNFIKDFAEIDKLRHLNDLKSMTIHGNPLEKHAHFRTLIIGLLPQLSKIDSALVTKRESQTASYYMKQNNFKKLPAIANARPPKQSSSEGQES